MAFEVPTYTELRNRITADVTASLARGGFKPGVMEHALIAGFAAAMLLFYKTLALAANNTVPTRAEAFIMRLWAAFFGVQPKPRTKHRGSATFVASPGSSIPAGWSIRLPTGIEFVTDALAEEDGGEIVVAFTAVKYGPAGRTLPGQPIFLGSPRLGVATQGVSGDIAGGQDDESDASVLARLIERLRDPPKGGTDADFRRWVKATSGVSVEQVWVYNQNHPLATDLPPSSAKTLFTVTPTIGNGWSPVPSEIEVSLVQAYVEPLTPKDLLHYYARAVTPQALDLTIQLSPNDEPTREAVRKSLRAMLLRQTGPRDYVLISQINEAISAASGEVDHVLVSPTSNVLADGDETIVVLGDVTFNDIP